MISAEYKLVEWLKDGSFEELEISIQQESVRDFCKMMEWDEEKFVNNTVRYPIKVEDESEITKPIIVKRKYIRRKKELGDGWTSNKRKQRTTYSDIMIDFIKENRDLSNWDLAKRVNKKFGKNMDNKQMSDLMKYRGIKRNIKKKKNGGVNKEFLNKYPVEHIDYIKSRKDIDDFELRDELIEMFQINYQVSEVRTILKMINPKEEILPMEEE